MGCFERELFEDLGRGDFERSANEGERILPLARLTRNRVKEAEALATIAWASLWRRNLDAAGQIPAEEGGWLLLRAWNDGADPLVLDLYPYATTSPIYLELPGGSPEARQDAAYFAAWMDRVIADAAIRNDYRTADERQQTLDYLRKAKDRYAALAGGE